MVHNNNNRMSEEVRLALLEAAKKDHDGDINNLYRAVKDLAHEVHVTGKELTVELTKTREAMIKKFSFMAGIATAFGMIGGMVGTGLALIVEYFSRKG